LTGVTPLCPPPPPPPPPRPVHPPFRSVSLAHRRGSVDATPSAASLRAGSPAPSAAGTPRPSGGAEGGDGGGGEGVGRLPLARLPAYATFRRLRSGGLAAVGWGLMIEGANQNWIYIKLSMGDTIRVGRRRSRELYRSVGVSGPQLRRPPHPRYHSRRYRLMTG
jgi:hypothetical protein